MQVENQIKENELISIIVPVYNVESYLAKCLDSILTQTYLSFEVILINDGSTDRSKSICEEYANKDNRFILINKKNGGVSSARNQGLSVAKGEYITFVDSDDRIKPQYLEVLYKNAKVYDADISMCKWVRNDSDNVVIGNKIEIWDEEQAFYNYFKFHQIDGNVYAKLYRHSCIRGLVFDEKLKIGEDQIFVIQAIEKSKKNVFQRKPLYIYNIRNASAMNLPIDKRYWDVVYRAEWLVREFKNKQECLRKLSKKEEINIYIIMVIRHIKEGTDESRKIYEAIYPKIKGSVCNEFFKYSSKYEFLRYFLIKYFLPIASVMIKIKDKI